MSSRISSYPYVVVRLTCGLCPRRGQYRLARLAAKYGPETTMAEVVYRLSQDCPYQRERWDRPPRKYQVRCCARLQDEDAPPPDVPAELRREGLRAIEGGRKDDTKKGPAARSEPG